MSGFQILLLAWFGFTLVAIFFLIILSYFNDRRVNREWSDEAEALAALQRVAAESWEEE